MTYVTDRGATVLEARWAVLAAQRSRLPTPATVLDLGAAEGDTSLRWGRAFPGDTVIACDPSPALLAAAMAHPDLALIVCRTVLTPRLLWTLGRCEQVDLTLCMNLLHHFGGAWDQALAAVLTLGDHLVIETPDGEDTGACQPAVVPSIHHAVQALPLEWLARLPSHTSPHSRWLGWLDTPATTLQQSYWGAPPEATRPGSIFIHQQDGRKQAVWPRRATSRPWIPGINLATYLALGGQWPTRAALAACATQTVGALARKHGDIRPWNWIVTGDLRQPLQLIDAGEYGSDDAEGLALTLAALQTCP